jgi:DNA-binding GntR family transcriptional regulator
MIAAHFETDSMPLMVALLRLEGRQALEVERGFVVPDGWRERAVQRRANTD